MHTILKKLTESLVDLTKIVDAQTPDEPQLLSETFGMTFPAIYAADFKDIPSHLIKRIKAFDLEILTEDEIEEIGYLIQKIKNAQKILVPFLFENNEKGSQANYSFLATLNYISSFLDSLLTFERLNEVNTVTKNLSRRIQSLSARLDIASPDIDNIEEKIEKIIKAHLAAENLPIDLDELQKANKEVSDIRDAVLKVKFDIESLHSDSSVMVSSLSSKESLAEGYLQKCEEAIRASTSKGLAGAFEIKANKLNWSIRFWVLGLASALAAGGYVGYERLQALSAVLDKPEPSVVVVVTQLLLSVFSIGAPLWFSWLSTKQINQRFKLAEDYAFKSSVAKAYEGYRKEASNLDDDTFKTRLFDSALSRLEEAPLRFVQDPDHATPWMEMLNSKAFDKFLNASIENVNFVKDLVSKKAGPSAVPREEKKIESD